MKICRNEFDIILYPVIKCSQCALSTRIIPSCFWLKIVGTHHPMDCGGIRTDILSDIFKL